MKKNMKKRILSIALSSTLIFGAMTTSVMAINPSTAEQIITTVNESPKADKWIDMFVAEFKTDEGIDALIELVEMGQVQEEIRNLRKDGVAITTRAIQTAIDEMRDMEFETVVNLGNLVRDGKTEEAIDILKEANIVKVSQQPVKPEFEENEVNFTDMDKSWATEDIKEMSKLGIVNGISETEFAPERKTTRNEMTALIVRVLGLETDIDVELPFKDVKPDSWDFGVIKAAHEAGIVNGTSEDTFSPSDEITREEMMVMINRAMEYSEVYATEVGKDIEDFDDYEEISDWSRGSMQNILDLNILKGKPENKIDPKGAATRAEAVSILKKAFDQLYK